MLFRAQSGLNVGTAHVRRCIFIAHELRARGVQPVFLVEESDTFQAQILKKEKIEFIILPHVGLSAQENLLYPPDVKTILIDVQNSENIKTPEALLLYLHALKAQNYKVLFLDALFDEAFRLPAAPVLDCVIQPYLGAEEDAPPKAHLWLKGADYVLMGPQFQNIPPKKIEASIQNILITCGGSDPQGISAFFLEALAQASQNIRVIVGPYFAPEHKNKLHSLAAVNPRIDLVENCTDLSAHYNWADFAFGTSGLSRYEFAAFGLPALILSIYPYHHRQCEIFKNYGICVYLGYYKNVASEQIQSAFAACKNQTKRQQMSIIGQGLIKPDGVKCLVQALQVINFE